MADELRKEYQEHRAAIREQFQWPHRLRLVCRGCGTHPETALSEVWVDKVTGKFNVLDQELTSRNGNNIKKRPTATQAYVVDGKNHTVHCRRCRATVVRDVEDMRALFSCAAWGQEKVLALDTMLRDIELARVSEAHRATMEQQRAGRPMQVMNREVWSEYAAERGLNVDGLNKRQIVWTCDHYRV